MLFKKVREFIDKHQKFILTAHESPDGDAIASELAMQWILEKLGKSAEIVNADPIPQKFSYLYPGRTIYTLEEGKPLPFDIKDRALLILDTNDIHNIGKIRDEILPHIKEYFIVDHHEAEDVTITDNLVISSASSTSEILYEMILYFEKEPDFYVSQCLFTGIVYDTGSFIYPKTSSRTFYIGYDLVRRGVSPNEIYSRIYESNSISSLRLQSRVMSTLQLHCGNSVAVQTMDKKMISDCGASFEEADTFINGPLKSENIKVSVFLKENEDGLLRCSMRSKNPIDVAVIAVKFGGGGHKTAAGFKCKEPLDETLKNVLNMLERYFKD
jgi:phosphoesterase RecJ-like protein